MVVALELVKSGVLLVAGVVLGTVLVLNVPFIAPTSDAPASHSAGFLAKEAVDGLSADSAFSGGDMDGASARMLNAASNLPFIQNGTGVRCGGAGDRVFVSDGMDLPGCYAECTDTVGCNHFSFAVDGSNAGRCIGCTYGNKEINSHHYFFTMQEVTPFACPNDMAESANYGSSVATLCGDAGDLPFIQNGTGARCGGPGDRVFVSNGMDLSGCVAECTDTEGCNHFSFAVNGPNAGRCIGCTSGNRVDNEHHYFFTMKETTPFSCPNDLIKYANHDTLVETLCATSTSTSTSTTGTSTATTTSISTTSTSSSTSTSTDGTTTTTSISTTSTTTTSISTTSTSSSTSTSTTGTLTSSSTSTSTTGTLTTTTSVSTTTTSSSTSTSTSTAYAFRSKADLKAAVVMWLTDKSTALGLYGDISDWITSQITDMRGLFKLSSSEKAAREPGNFTNDISTWDVSQVTTMKRMFDGFDHFNLDLSAWDVGSVQSMENMFDSAQNFNVSLYGWDVHSLTTMEAMFEEASSFTADLSEWNFPSLRDMSFVFFGCDNFHVKGIELWDVSKVESMGSMFELSSFNQDISSWNVSSARSMIRMFYGAASFNIDISQWDVSNVLVMSGMFFGAKEFNQDISTWDVSKVFSGDISGWDVSSVRFMDLMFEGADAFLNVDVSVWHPSSLQLAPWNFISPQSVACTQGDWSHWGDEAPTCVLH